MSGGSACAKHAFTAWLAQARAAILGRPALAGTRMGYRDPGPSPAGPPSARRRTGKGDSVRRALSVLGVVIAALLTVIVLRAGALSAAAQDAAAYGNLVDSTGKTIGTVQLQQIPNGVATTVEVAGLSSGSHGIHFRAVGRCDAPDFTSAGEPFNPTKNRRGPFAGDLPDLQADAAGLAIYSFTSRTVTLSPGPISLFDADGAALVISADPGDDAATRV